jgi:hypothetical protein
MGANMWAVLASAALAMAFGAIWYGPIWGKKWLEINGADAMDLAAREAMMKETNILYVLQFGMTVVQLYVLQHFIGFAWDEKAGIGTALLAWLGFVVPTIAGLAMWNAKPRKVRLTLFALSAGYQFFCFVAFGIILSLWQ